MNRKRRKKPTVKRQRSKIKTIIKTTPRSRSAYPLASNIGPMLAVNIGPILVKHVVQYWPNIGHNIAPIVAALHNDNIVQYWVIIATILASTHSNDIPPIYQGNIVPALTILVTILDRIKVVLFRICLHF